MAAGDMKIRDQALAPICAQVDTALWPFELVNVKQLDRMLGTLYPCVPLVIDQI